MKKFSPLLSIILLFSISMNAQSNTYDSYLSQWKIVQEYESKGLPKSALTEVKKIYTKARAANNHAQVIKSLLHQSKYALTLEENAQLNIVDALKKEISEANFPTKNILESILADLYWQYFQQNRWRFYNRTNTSEKVDPTDFRTWGLQTIFEEAHSHYQKSLENALESQQVSISTFKDILTRNKNSEKYRPTLYDFLAHSAIGFYKNDERNLTRPAYKFEIDNPNLIGTNVDFLKEQLQSKDSLSQQLHALHIYKNLSLFHARDVNKTTLVHLTLERLSFVHNNAIFDNKDAHYLSTLKALKTRYQNDENATEIDYKIAFHLNKEAGTYVPVENEEHQWKRKEALDICNAAIATFPESTGAQKCKNLQSQILRKSLQITAEKFVPIGNPSRLLVTYKNMNQLYFKALEISRKQQLQFNNLYKDSERIAFIKKLKVTKIWDTSLRNEGDFQQHKTEVLLPALAQGNYMIFASSVDDFSKENTFAYTFIQATNLTLIENTTTNKYRYQVVNRNTGEPIAGAKVYLKNYDTNRYNKSYQNTLITNKKGFIEFQVNDSFRNIIATVTHKDDTAVFGDYYLNKLYRNRKDNTKREHIFLFSDRSIYRPGQTVYFKGITVAMKANKSSSVEGRTVNVILKDVNYQEIKTLTLKTNEFGSFSGEFILPNTGLTGNFTIQANAKSLLSRDTNNSINFSVEEYKRPKFEAKFKPVTESYKINDSITVNGFAKAFAGSNITDAEVNYRVFRTAQYPKWYWYYRPSISSESQEISHGETVTDAQGNFSINFKALPDLKVKKETQPTFNYKVIADVVDINGETRSTESIVNVGYHTLNVSITIDNELEKTKKAHTIEIATKNLNGQAVSAKGVLKIYKLQAPENVLRPRLWAAPDYQEFSEVKFKELFPHDAYKNEDNAAFWKKGKLIFETKIDTKKTSEITLKNLKKWQSGLYIAVVECKDKFGQTVKDEQRFNVYGIKDQKLANKELFSIQTDKSQYNPNDVVKFTIGSASKDLTATITIEKDYAIVDTQMIKLCDNKQTITIPVKQGDLGGFAIHYQLVNYNAFKSGTINISVPYPKHELNIETTTFRDKLQPGQNETWSFKLKGSKGDKAAAEILASMYDASLDQFKPHNWYFSPIGYQYYYGYNRSNANRSFGNSNFRVHQAYQPSYGYPGQYFDTLNWFGFRFGRGQNRNQLFFAKGLNVESIEEDANEIAADESGVTNKIAMYEAVRAPEMKAKESNEDFTPQNSADKYDNTNKKDLSQIVARKNLQETAFFYPYLKTDVDGNVSFNFTVPESLTQWKLQLLAHTKDMASATQQLTTVTQKELMVLPNPPRFLREGDTITFASKIANLTDIELTGISELQLFDALTNAPIDAKLGNAEKRQNFTVDAKGNTNVSWTLNIPDDVQAVKYRIVAKAADFSDGEENALPVLSNRMLVTETLPMWIRSNQTKTFTLDKLKNNRSATLKNHKLTLEVTSNPAWYAVQALPYLMEYPYECSEQTFSRYYANALASHIANSNPRIQDVFNQWASADALVSNLEKNQELKSLIIQETPWLRDALSETEQKKRIALLFDLNKMQNELQSASRKLSQMQMGDGGFPWFKGSRYPNRYITQHIATGFAHLNKLGVAPTKVDKNIVDRALLFSNNEIFNDYNKHLREARRIRESAKTKAEGLRKERAFLANYRVNYLQIQYLYLRSFYNQRPLGSKYQKAVDYYRKQAYKFWLETNLYSKGLIALVAHRNGDTKMAQKIMTSLKENAITSDELGMYWKSNTSSWNWYQAPIETQALLIEAFGEIDGDIKLIDELKIWLLKNKQTNRWKTTKATTEAVYALLLQGSDWLEVNDFVGVEIGNDNIEPLQLEDSKVEAGTGYFKTSWSSNEITSKMAEVKLSKKSNGIAWGALYWQYFEDLDKITSAETPLKLRKKLFLKTNTDKGEELYEITDKTALKLGDLVKVRVELRVDRAMEFVHMKDMRAAGFEPVNVLSQYKYQDGLGYYESTKDAATNFFFDYLPKGVYVFEYDLRVNNKGDFSNGITTIQSMYAPEFSSHSEGVRVKIGK